MCWIFRGKAGLDGSDHLVCKQGVTGSIPVRSTCLTRGSIVTSTVGPPRTSTVLPLLLPLFEA